MSFIDEDLTLPFVLSPEVPIADELYTALGPWFRKDLENPEYPLLHLCRAIGEMIQDVDFLYRDAADDRPGWSSIVDIDHSPSPEWLNWLQQFYGARVNTDPVPYETDIARADRIRRAIHTAIRYRRGSRPALNALIESYMSPPTAGAYDYMVVERYLGGAWKLRVSIRATQIADPVRLEADIRTLQKPAGIVLTFSTYVGGDFNTLRDTHTNFDDVTASFTDFNDITSDPSQT